MEMPQSSVLEALSSTYAIAIKSDALSEAREIINALRLIGPKTVEWDGFYAAIEMQAGNWGEAARLYRNCPNLIETWAFGRAALACCLFQTKDEEWRLHAQAVLRIESDDARPAQKMVAALFTRIGEFVPGMRESEAPAAAPEVQMEMPLAMYMRA